MSKLKELSEELKETDFIDSFKRMIKKSSEEKQDTIVRYEKQPDNKFFGGFR